jgi:hypothetical protein
MGHRCAEKGRWHASPEREVAIARGNTSCARLALRHVPAERLTLNPICEFAPSANNSIPLDLPKS